MAIRVAYRSVRFVVHTGCSLDVAQGHEQRGNGPRRGRVAGDEQQHAQERTVLGNVRDPLERELTELIVHDYRRALRVTDFDVLPEPVETRHGLSQFRNELSERRVAGSPRVIDPKFA